MFKSYVSSLNVSTSIQPTLLSHRSLVNKPRRLLVTSLTSIVAMMGATQASAELIYEDKQSRPIYRTVTQAPVTAPASQVQVTRVIQLPNGSQTTSVPQTFENSRSFEILQNARDNAAATLNARGIQYPTTSNPPQNSYQNNSYQNNSYQSNDYLNNGYQGQGYQTPVNTAPSYSSSSPYSTPNVYPSPSGYPSPAIGMDTSINYFREAQDAGRRNDSGELYRYEQMMGGGLFAMYPAYWRLDNELSTLNPGAVTQFGRQYSGSVMAEKLVADYAETKAKAGDYAAVRQVANLIMNPDSSEKCAIALGYNHAGDAMRALASKPDVWLTTKKQPALCTQLATEMSNNPMISNADREARLYRMLRLGNTGDIMALSQALGTPIDYSALSRIQLDPNGYIRDFNMGSGSQIDQYLYLYAIGRIADKSYSEAAMQLNYDVTKDDQRPRRILSDQTRRYAYRTLAVKRMNFNTDDGFSADAVTWFRNSVGEPFNFEEAEDYAQAAIRFSEWRDLITVIGSMDVAEQQQPIWQYWLARAYEQVGDNSQKAQARQIYQTLAASNEYYGLLAKDKVGMRFDVSQVGGRTLPTVSQARTSRMLKDPSFARAFALYQSDADRNFANREWNWAVRMAKENGDHDLIVAAAKYAHDLGWLDRSIYAIDSTDDLHQYALSHPMPHQDAVTRYSRQVGIDPAWAYGIMRQESRFVTAARSGVGASGLMQIMPGTAKYIARNLGESYSASRANSGDTNIRYGTWYMSDVMEKLNQQPVLATAGYNAGPNKAKRWQPTYGSLAADQYVDTIAYPETRNYVKRVMENATIYGDLLGRTVPLTQRMGTIPASY